MNKKILTPFALILIFGINLTAFGHSGPTVTLIHLRMNDMDNTIV